MITPTVGRVVWFRDPYIPRQPKAAIIVYVWSDRCVNLVVFDENGVSLPRTSVTLRQDGDESPPFAFCEWMPYQKGQAAKTEAAEAALAQAKA